MFNAVFVMEARPLSKLKWGLFMKYKPYMFRRCVRRYILVDHINRTIKRIEDGTEKTYPLSELWDTW